MTADEWETRYTRVIVRNLSKLRENAGYTIEQFARRCDEVVGEPGRFKPNTLQALFAGKRKNVSISEAEVFAEALRIPLAAILVPIATGESLPTPRGDHRSAFGAWQHLTGEGMTSSTDAAAEVFHELGGVSSFGRALSDLRSDLFAFRYFDPDYAGAVKVITPRGVLLEQVRGALRLCSASLRQFDRAGFTVDEDDPLVLWARHTNADYLTEEALVDFARRLVKYYDDEDAQLADVFPTLSIAETDSVQPDWFASDGSTADPA